MIQFPAMVNAGILWTTVEGDHRMVFMADKIMIGHSNMDLDCFGSMVMARYLFPEHRLVRSGRIHPVAKNLYTIYREQLNMIAPKDLKQMNVDEILVLDTRQYDRVKEYFRFLPEYFGFDYRV
jgi:nanoRNase/pAp phosphatase (c-di-AMP/oligoRNAs hydrolase)